MGKFVFLKVLSFSIVNLIVVVVLINDIRVGVDLFVMIIVDRELGKMISLVICWI